MVLAAVGVAREAGVAAVPQWPWRKPRPGLDAYGRSDVWHAAAAGDVAAVTRALRRGSDPTAADKDGFTGLFGIRGGIKIFMDAATGVPVLITGELPVPVIGKLDLYVRLKSYSRTPEGFAPLR